MGQTIPIENSGQIGIIVGSTLSIFIAAIFVFLRLVAKHISSGLDYSEYCIVAALVCSPLYDILVAGLTVLKDLEHRTSYLSVIAGHSWRLWFSFNRDPVPVRP